MKKYIFFSIIFFGVLFFAKESFAATCTETFYISPTGSSNPANPKDPITPGNMTWFNNTANWATVVSVDNKIGPGDCVNLLNGIYNAQMIPRKSGIAGYPITIQGDTGANAIIDGTGLGMIALVDLGEGSNYANSYLTFQNFTIQNAAGPGGSTALGGCNTNACTYITLRNMYFTKNRGRGTIYAGDANGNSNWLITGCRFYDNGLVAPTDHHIYFAHMSNSIIEYNYFDTIPAFSVQLQNNCTNNIIRYNYSTNAGYNGQGTGFITLWETNACNNEVYGNISDNDYYFAGIQGGCTNKIYNNTVYGFKTGALWSSGSGTEVKNNIFYSAGKTIYAGPFTTTNNLENVDPKFVSPTTGDFSLQSNSPAINAGVNLGATWQMGLKPGVTKNTFSSQGVSELSLINRGSAWDIGAYEYVGVTPDTTPPSPPTNVRVN